MFHGVALRRVHAPRRARLRGRPGTSTCKSGGIGADAEPVDLYQCGVAAHTVVILYWVQESCAQSPLQGEKYVHIGPGGHAARLAAAVVCASQGGDLA